MSCLSRARGSLKTFAVVAAITGIVGCGDSTSDEAPTSYEIVQHLTSASEDAGTVVGVATVTLNRAAKSPVEVWVNSNNNGELYPIDTPLVIPSGEREGTVSLGIADDDRLGPDRHYTVMIDALDGNQVIDFTVTDDEPHALTLSVAGPIEENAVSFHVTVTAAAAVTEAVEIQFDDVEVHGLLLPSVTLGAGSATTQAYGSIFDNTLLDFDRTVLLTALPSSLLDTATLEVTIADDEPQSLAATASTASLGEGDGVASDALLVEVGADLAAGLELTLSSDDDVLQVPATVQLAAGTRSVAVALTVVDDNLLNGGDRSATITVDAAPLPSDSATFTVVDDETAQVALVLPQSSVGEADGLLASWASVTSGPAVASDLTVTLASDDESEVTVPASVTIPAGQNTVAFDVTVVDDALLDFDRVVNLSADTALGTAQEALTVTDAASPALTLTINTPSLSEAAGTTMAAATVSTAQPVESALLVSVDSSDLGELDVQRQATIAAGESEADISVYPIDDSDMDFDTSIDILVSATGCVDASEPLLVLDDDTGYVVEFEQADGSEDWIDFGAIPGFMVGSDWTVVQRFSVPAGATMTGYQFMRGNAFQDQSGDFTVTLDRQLDGGVWKWTVGAWVLGGASIGMTVGQNGVDILDDGAWHTAILQYENSSETLTLYVDGVSMASATSNAVDDSANSNRLIWGGQVADASYGVGELYLETDSVLGHQAWLRRLLTPAEIAAYDGTVDPTDPTLVFATAIGNGLVIDVSGNGYDGTTHGSPQFFRP